MDADADDIPLDREMDADAYHPFSFQEMDADADGAFLVPQMNADAENWLWSLDSYNIKAIGTIYDNERFSVLAGLTDSDFGGTFF